MSRKGLRVHTNVAPGSKGYTARGGQTLCRDGFLLLEGTILADQTNPCPICNKTAAANMVAWKIILTWMAPPQPETQHIFEQPKVAAKVNRSDADLSEIDTTGFNVIRVPEGVMPKVNREGKVIRKGGEVVMQTVDYRSDGAVSRRMVGGSSKWGKGNVTGSTSVCSTWAVPARPGSDAMANSDEVLKDLRSANTQNMRAKQRKTPRKGRHVTPKTQVVRRYTV